MKKTFTTAFLTIAAAFGFAQDVTPDVRPNLTQLEVTPALPSLKEKVTPKKSFGYLRMGVSDTELNKTDIQVLPGVGLGYRLVAGSSAIDLSASFNRRKTVSDEGREETWHYTVPKANYLYYLSAESNNSFYAGAGLAWGGVDTRNTDGDKSSFIGLIPNVALGYELNRTGTLRSFIQLDVSQPAIAAVKEGAFPKTFAELAVGAGF
ncbi:MAG: hypothetical protein K1X28_03090 [Parachlamydiales bacterium]|nr:hypothetical protein [Parachlamydiales bacterium]